MNKAFEIIKKYKMLVYFILLVLYYICIDFFNQYLMFKIFDLKILYDKTAIIFNILWVLLFLIISYLLKPKLNKIVTLIFNIFLLVFSIANYFVFSYFSNVVSWKDIVLTGEGLDFISSVFKFINLKLIIFLIITIIMIIVIYKLTPKYYYKFKSIQTIIIIIFLIIMGFCYYNNDEKLTNINDSWLVEDVIDNNSNYYSNWINSNKLINIGGTYDYIFRDFYWTFLKKYNLVESEKFVDDYISSYESSQSNEYQGIFKNKNLILIMMESMDDWLINEDVTPTIYNMMQKGFNFHNHYSPDYITGATANTEFIANTGIYPIVNSLSPVYAYVNNNYSFSLPNMFKNSGYIVNSFHRSLGNVYNRDKMHISLGYSNYYDYTKMGIDFDNQDYDTNLISDGYDMIIQENKFMSSIITFTPHAPYIYSLPRCLKNLDDIKEIYPNLDSEEELCAYSVARETDNMFKLLLEKLESDNLLNNTVIVAFTDHPNNVVLRENETEKLNKTVFFIYDNTMDNHQIETITSTINILPTLKNLFGFENDYVYPGYDALNTKEGYVLFKDYTYYDGKSINPLTEREYNQFQFSKSILITDYYKNQKR